MTDPLGRSQVLPYLTGLAARGHRITLISCEKQGRAAAEWAVVRALCGAAGIEWQPLRYTRRPPIVSTLRDLAAMRRLAFALRRAHGFDIVHCRSYLTALVGVSMKRRWGARFLFDMRGFWADEKAEGGAWPQRNPLFRAIYRYFKRREANFFRDADHIVSLTRVGRDEIERWPGVGVACEGISVIPCCVDFDHFAAPSSARRQSGRLALGIDPDRPVLVYLGSLGGNYMLPEMLRLFDAYRRRRPGALFLFVTRDPLQPIIDAAAALGIGRDEVMIRAASREEVPELIAAADLGVAFKQPNFSAKACSPTKLGEMLAMGVPVIANREVGDVGEMLDQSGAGVAIDRFDQASYAAAIEAADRITLSPDQIRAAARRLFALDDGVAAYDAIYARLGAQLEGVTAKRAI